MIQPINLISPKKEIMKLAPPPITDSISYITPTIQPLNIEPVQKFPSIVYHDEIKPLPIPDISHLQLTKNNDNQINFKKEEINDNQINFKKEEINDNQINFKKEEINDEQIKSYKKSPKIVKWNESLNEIELYSPKTEPKKISSRKYIGKGTIIPHNIKSIYKNPIKTKIVIDENDVLNKKVESIKNNQKINVENALSINDIKRQQ